MKDDDYAKIVELMHLCEPVEAFKFDGVIFLGYWPEAIKTYMELRPSKKFYVWLCDNYKRIA